jgi:uncharacterized protein (TIGR03790 family)
MRRTRNITGGLRGWGRAAGAAAGLAALLACFGLFGAPATTGQWDPNGFFRQDEFLSNNISALARDVSERMWVGTDKGALWTSDLGRTWNIVDLAYAQPRTPGRRAGTNPEKRPGGEALLRRNAITCVFGGRNGVWIGTLDGLCFVEDDLRAYSLFNREIDGIGPAIWAVAEYMGEVWVSASNGIFKSGNGGAVWVKVEGNFPPMVTSILLGEGPRGRSCWLGGFDATPRYAGGPDVLRSDDGGRTWKALKTGTAEDVARVVSSRAHKLVFAAGALWACTRHGLARSADGGENWARVRGMSGTEAEEVFDIAWWGSALWAATREGMLSSEDAGEKWRRVGVMRCPVRQAAAAGRYLWMGTSGGVILRGRGADLRSFSAKTNVLSMTSTQEYGADTWWVGTTAGLHCTRDNGKSWRTYTVADGLPSNVIQCLASNGESVWAGTDGGVWVNTDGAEPGRSFDRGHGLRGLDVRDIVLAGRDVWAATDRGLSVLRGGLTEWRTVQSARDWRAVCVVNGTVLGAVVDPADAAGRHSVIAGSTERDAWTPLLIPAHHGAVIHQMMVLGEDVWMASDAGLYRSRDAGESWARFGSETLWAGRATRLCRGEGNVLCVQSVPTNPPSLTAFVNVTRDGGRTWSVLGPAVPGHARALMVVDDRINGDRLVAGSATTQTGLMAVKGGLSVLAGYEQQLRAARTGWYTWNRIAALASSTWRQDRLGAVSAIDREGFHGPTLWFGSTGAGMVEKGVPAIDAFRRMWDVTGSVPLDVSRFAALGGEEITAMTDSPEGIWVGTATGLCLYERQESQKFWAPGEGGPAAAPVRAIAVAEGAVWVGTDKGLSVLDRKSGAWTTLTPANSPLPNERVTCLAWDGARLWGGTQQGAFAHAPGGEWKTLLDEERINDIALGSVREYFATDRGVFARDRDGQPRRHLHRGNSALTDNEVMRVFVDGQEVWAFTAKGVGRLPNDAAESPSAPYSENSLRTAEGVLVVVNDNSPESVRIAQEYAQLRGVPAGNVCRLRCSTEETVPRHVFMRDIRNPVRQHLIDRGLTRAISFIVTTSGVPLRIGSDPILPTIPGVRTEAGVDSELTLVGSDPPLNGALPNPYLGRDEVFNSTQFGMYLVTRLDGPTVESALALARDAVETEQNRSYGARGFARLDLNPQADPAAERLNAAIFANYKPLAHQERLMGRVAPPERTTLPFFRPGSAYTTFFFLGWGYHEYPAGVFSWTQGAIGINADPGNAQTLRDARGSWVAGAVERRLTATIGTVYEPGKDALALANVFRYVKAGYTWGEIAYMSIPHLSWQAVVIGDPLYTPQK